MAERKRKGLKSSNLSKAKSIGKGRRRDRYRRLERYAIYIADRFENDGRKSPIFGVIEKAALDFLKLKLSDLQKIPGNGTYTSVEGLKLDYNFVENTLWKTTTGSANGATYNNTSPVPLLAKPLKVTIQVKSTTTKSGFSNLAIGVPPDFTYADAATFIAKHNIGKNEKVAKWTFGKNSETLRDLGQAKKSSAGTGSAKEDSAWYVPIGLDLSVKRNQNGLLSAAPSAVKKKSLVVATLRDRCAKLLGFSNAVTTDAKAIEKGTTINLAFDKSGSGETGKTYRAFETLNVYSKILEKVSDGSPASPLDPGTGTTVKVSFVNRSLSASKPKEGQAAKKATTKNKSTYATFLVPSGTPVGLIYNMLTNVKIRPNGFSVSTDGKNFGNTYQIPPKGGLR